MKKYNTLGKPTLIIHTKDIKHPKDPHTLALLTAPQNWTRWSQRDDLAYTALAEDPRLVLSTDRSIRTLLD